VDRNRITEQIVVARLRLGLTCQQLADAIDRPVVWTTSALLGRWSPSTGNSVPTNGLRQIPARRRETG
jgi:cyanate lyase